MPSPLTTLLIAILGTGLAAVSVACVVLWLRVRDLARPDRSVPVDLVDGAAKVRLRTSEPRDRRPPSVPHGPASKPRHEVARRLDELAGRSRAIEERLARVEAAVSGPSPVRRADPGPTRRVNRGSSATPGGPTLISVPNLAATPSPSPGAAAEMDRRFGGVWGMADAGMPAEAIARETGHPIGQVELILGLRRQLLAAEAGPDA